jgi:LAS superfamily LD-carboxypeptidase LdcB
MSVPRGRFPRYVTILARAGARGYLSSVSNERHCERMLSSLELTGRAHTHVSESAELGCLLHAQAARALIDLKNAARTAGIDVAVLSGYRDLGRQAAIWNAKFRGDRRLLARDGSELERSRLPERALIEAILAWSALPGASRHHWGSDADVIDAARVPAGYRPQLVAHEFAREGVFAPLSDWLAEHAWEFGFFRPYSSDRGGVMPEPWHLSYAPLAVPALSALTPQLLAEAIGSSSMDGRELVLARLPELYERYVLAIDPPPGRSAPRL